MEVDNAVRHWLSMTVDYDTVIHGRPGHVVGKSMGIFYMEDVLVGLGDPG